MPSLSNLIETLDNCWRDIQFNNSDVPDSLIIVAGGGRKARTTYGHFLKNSWEKDGVTIHEVLLVAEQLHRGPVEVFNTLLHEAVHGIAYNRGIKDTSGDRHNKRFARIANEVGLVTSERPSKRFGYAQTQLDLM